MYLAIQPTFDARAAEELRVQYEGDASSASTAMWGNGSTFYTGGHDGYKALLVKWDPAGNILWERTWASFYGIQCLWAYGSYVVTVDGEMNYQYLVKWDSEGNVLWNRSLSVVASFVAYAMWGNGTDLYTCGRDLFSDFKLIKWNSTGGIEWQRTNTSFSTGSSICGNGQTFYVAARSGATNFTLLKWDGEGNCIWNYTYNLDVSNAWGWSPNCVWVAGDSVYITLTPYMGYSYLNDLLVKVDSTGQLIWIRQVEGRSLIPLDLVWGTETEIFTCGYYSRNMLLIKWDADGNIVWTHRLSSGHPTGVWANSSTIFLSGTNDVSNHVLFMRITLEPLQLHRILVPIVCGAGIFVVFGYMIKKDREMKNLKKDMLSRRSEAPVGGGLRCINCGSTFLEKYEYCPYCGKPI